MESVEMKDVKIPKAPVRPTKLVMPEKPIETYSMPANMTIDLDGFNSLQDLIDAAVKHYPANKWIFKNNSYDSGATHMEATETYMREVPNYSYKWQLKKYEKDVKNYEYNAAMYKEKMEKYNEAMKIYKKKLAKYYVAKLQELEVE